MICRYTSYPGQPLYKKLEDYLKSHGYEKPWERYEILTDIDDISRDVSKKYQRIYPYLILGLHSGIEPVDRLARLMHRRLIGAAIFMIKYNNVELEKRLKSHETTAPPFLNEKIAEIVFSLHAMPNEWLGSKIAIGGLPEETRFKCLLADELKKAVPVDKVILANANNGFRELIVSGQKETNPVNYTAIEEGIQLEFPAILLKNKLYDEKILNAIMNSISAISDPNTYF